MRGELELVAKKYPDLATFQLVGGSTNQDAPFEIELHASTNSNTTYKAHVLLIGALNGDEPMGSEMLMRLVRHLVSGTRTVTVIIKQ